MKKNKHRNITHKSEVLKRRVTKKKRALKRAVEAQVVPAGDDRLRPLVQEHQGAHGWLACRLIYEATSLEYPVLPPGGARLDADGNK